MNTRVKTPCRRQVELTDCGAVALEIVLSYYQYDVPIRVLREQCAVSRDGVSVTSLVLTAKHYGLEAKLFYTCPKPESSIANPLILFWNKKHYVVLEGFKRDRVYINDPLIGRQILDYATFEQRFSGIAVQLFPGQGFNPAPKKRKWPIYFRFLWGKEWRSLSLIFFLTCIMTILNLTTPVFSRFMIDQYVQKEQNEHWLFFAIVTLALITQWVVILIQRKTLRQLENNIALRLSTKLTKKLINLPLAFFAQRRQAEGIHLLQASERIAELFSGSLYTALLGLVQVSIYLALILYHSLFMGLLVLVISFFNMGFLFISKRYKQDVHAWIKQELVSLSALTLSYLSLVLEIKITQCQKNPLEKWHHKLENYLLMYRKHLLSNAFIRSVSTFLFSLSHVTLICFGTWFCSQGYFSMGDLVACSILFLSFNEFMHQAVNLKDQFHQAQMDYQRTTEIIEYPMLESGSEQCSSSLTHREHQSPVKSIGPVDNSSLGPLRPATCSRDPEIQDHSRSLCIDQDRSGSREQVAGRRSLNCQQTLGKIELLDVTFGYCKASKPLFKNLNLTIEPKSKIAITGPSGSGKSTFAYLLAGLYTPWDGAILIDGRELSNYLVEERAALIGLVSQEQFFFQGSIHDNLCLWSEDYTTSDLQHVTQLACIDDFIRNTQEQFNFQLSEGGKNLSSGQRQRLELARTLLVEPSILILDEASSAIDPFIEDKINRNLRALNNTMITIAHRLSCIRDADIIYILKNGQLIESGTHQQLWAKKSLSYHALFEVESSLNDILH
jgi:ATP-binding cassette subfamily C protein